jgi:hypothetical protein
MGEYDFGIAYFADSTIFFATLLVLIAWLMSN